jgi:hypothetical protein
MHGSVKRRLLRWACAVAAANPMAFSASPTPPLHAQERAAADESNACFAAAEQAQPLMRQKRLREARVALEMCARDVCPRIARTDCRNWLADVVSEQSSVRIAPQEVRGSEVHDLHGVRAIIDGAIAMENADVNAVTVDPGRHRLRVERAGAEALEQDIDVREGEKDHVIHVYWRAAAPVAPPPHEQREVPQAAYVTGALGVAAVAAGTYFELLGLARRGDLNGKCQPTRTCAQSDVDSARTLVGIGDASLGIGLLLLTGAGYLYWTRPAARHDQITWMVSPLPTGWAAGFERSW